jgi:hypothetical protein
LHFVVRIAATLTTERLRAEVIGRERVGPALIRHRPRRCRSSGEQSAQRDAGVGHRYKCARVGTLMRWRVEVDAARGEAGTPGARGVRPERPPAARHARRRRPPPARCWNRRWRYGGWRAGPGPRRWLHHRSRRTLVVRASCGKLADRLEKAVQKDSDRTRRR